MTSSKYVRVEKEGDAIVIVPLFTFGRFTEADLFDEWRRLQAQLEESPAKNVIFDLGEIPYFGSTVLDWMVQVWRHAKARGGQLATCNCSPIGKEVLAAARFDTLWGVFDSRRAAQESFAAKASA